MILIFPVAGLGVLTALSNGKIEAQAPAVNNTTSPNNDITTSKAKVKFKKPKQVKDIVELASRNNVKLDELESSYIVGNREIYSGYIVDSDKPDATTKTATELESYIKEARLNFFNDMVAGEDNLSSEERKELKPHLDAMKAALAKRDVGEILVVKATLSGELSNLKQLSQNNDLEQVDIKDKERLDIIQKQNKIQREKLQGEKDFLKQLTRFSKSSRFLESLNPATLLAQTTSSTWYPNSGRSETGQSANAPYERYTRQFMRWNANRFLSTDTYEHEFYLDDVDGRTYLSTTTSSTPQCMPQVRDWNTTWTFATNPYLDTRLEQSGGCEQDIVGFVLGAATASNITSGVTHYTYIRTYDGNITSDRFYLSAQRGHRDSTHCVTTWCSFGDTKVTLVPQWSVNVPRVKDWTRP